MGLPNIVQRIIYEATILVFLLSVAIVVGMSLRVATCHKPIIPTINIEAEDTGSLRSASP